MMNFILLHILTWPALVTSDLPVYEITNNWYKLGELASHRIQKYQWISPTVAKLKKIMQNKNVSRAYDTLLSSHCSAFPEFAKELQDMASGAQVEYKDLVMYSFKNELLAVYGEQAPDTEESECSDVLIHTADQHINGHNEDGEAELANVSYWVKTSEFEAMSYPGQLPGGAVGFNRHGLVLTVNALSPKDAVVDRGCVGKYWTTRKVLACKSIAEAVDFLQSTCHTYGMSLNVGSTVTGEQVNIEVGPGRKLSVNDITSGSYFHANAYLHLHVRQDPKLSPSSAHREARAKELLPVTNITGVLQILGDTQDVHWPIYRTLGHGDYAVTLVTAVFDFKKQYVDVWSESNPIRSSPLFRRSLSESWPARGYERSVVVV